MKKEVKNEEKKKEEEKKINNYYSFRNYEKNKFLFYIIQILYHSPLIKEEINKFNFEKEDILNPLYQLKSLFLE